MMTIIDENKNMNKYNYLLFVEFLEMLCRLALILFKEHDTVENKVFYLLKIIYDHQYEKGKWNPKKEVLVPIDYEN